jgi:dTDP-4-dehydrorhamnose 3,5-epimerase
MEPLGIEGAWMFTPQVHRDDRGSFLETFRGDEFAAALGYRLDVAQVNCSVSRRGVLRGIHYADVPPGQAKYVCCLSGAVVDVVVDLRAGSQSFGKWEAVRLDDSSRRAVFLAEGLGHGFMAVSDQATVTYLCSTPYAPGREHGVNPLDPALGIGWPLEEAAEPVLSGKDAAAPSLDEALRDGLLPRYADCVAYSGELRSRLRRQSSRLRRQPSGLRRQPLRYTAKARWSRGAVLPGLHSSIAGHASPGRHPFQGRHDPDNHLCITFGPSEGRVNGHKGPKVMRGCVEGRKMMQRCAAGSATAAASPPPPCGYAASMAGNALISASRQSPIGLRPAAAHASCRSTL